MAPPRRKVEPAHCHTRHVPMNANSAHPDRRHVRGFCSAHVHVGVGDDDEGRDADVDVGATRRPSLTRGKQPPSRPPNQSHVILSEAKEPPRVRRAPLVCATPPSMERPMPTEAPPTTQDDDRPPNPEGTLRRGRRTPSLRVTCRWVHQRGCRSRQVIARTSSKSCEVALAFPEGITPESERRQRCESTSFAEA